MEVISRDLSTEQKIELHRYLNKINITFQKKIGKFQKGSMHQIVFDLNCKDIQMGVYNHLPKITIKCYEIIEDHVTYIQSEDFYSYIANHHFEEMMDMISKILAYYNMHEFRLMDKTEMSTIQTFNPRFYRKYYLIWISKFFELADSYEITHNSIEFNLVIKNQG